MKNINLLLFIILISYPVYGQTFNQEIKREKDTLLIGKINKQALQDGKYQEWFTKNYNDYQPDTTLINSFKKDLKKHTITAFMGTWCGDSKKEIPIMYKVLDQAEFPLERLTLIALDRDGNMYKRSTGGEQEGLNIHRVPTLIFYKNGIEVNRIIEHPITSIESDINQILKNDYEPNYKSVAMLNTILNEKGADYVLKKQKKILRKLKPHSKSYGELNTFTSILSTKNEDLKKALAVATINTLLYPEKARTFSKLGVIHYWLDEKEEAIENYEKAIQLEPDNESLKENLEYIKNN